MGSKAKRAGFGTLSAPGLAVWAALAVVSHAVTAPASAQDAGSCAKVEFESAVDGAAEALRDLNNNNRPEFQNKLRQLKDKRGWDNDKFMKEAAPFVKDDQIAVFDEKSNELLASISSMGQEGAAAPAPDCTMLAKLRDLMKVLIDTQTAKWTYMFKKLDDELAK
jgi:hypothetical protein